MAQGSYTQVPGFTMMWLAGILLLSVVLLVAHLMG